MLSSGTYIQPLYQSGFISGDYNRLSPAGQKPSTRTLEDNRPQSLVQRKQIQALKWRRSAETVIQKKTNTTGLPDQLKSGIENLSGHSMDDVKVNYNSDKPAQLNAHAYAQGTEIHIASGQEKHLAHEAWHVVQQKQGRVKPTKQMKGKVNINDDAGLEKEADVMGAKAISFQLVKSKIVKGNFSTVSTKIAQRVLRIDSSTASPFHQLKFNQFRSLKKRMPITGEAWGILKQLAGSQGVFSFPTWEDALSRAQKIYNFRPDAVNLWKHYQTTGKAEQRKTIKQPGYATGDQFGIAAAMIVNPLFDVVISSGPAAGQPNHDSTDKAQAIKSFYLESGIEPWRIKIAYAPDVRNSNNQMRDTIKTTYQKEFGVNLSNSQVNNQRSASVSEGTYYLARHWSDESKKKVKKAWKVNALKDANIATWLASMHVPVRGDKIAILWSRFSGKKGDIHLEHDTSYHGMQQLVSLIAPYYSAVIIAGDPSAIPAASGKFTVIANRSGLNVFNLTGFWSNDTPLLRSWGGNTRTGQFKLYDYLNRNFAELKHLGARSGNLEVMAMLGHKTRYTEEPGSRGAERMESWHEVADGRTQLGGKATGYERLMIHRPPTRSGQYLLANSVQYGDRPLWAIGRNPGRVKPDGIYRYPKGFDKRDLQAICAYFGVPIPFITTTTALTMTPPARGLKRIEWAVKLFDLPMNGFDESLLRAKYREMALKYHPDKNSRGAVMMVNVNSARDALLNWREELEYEKRERGLLKHGIK